MERQLWCHYNRRLASDDDESACDDGNEEEEEEDEEEEEEEGPEGQTDMKPDARRRAAASRS